MKRPFKIIRDFLRGAVKSFPLGNAVVEGIENVKKEKVSAENITEAINTTNVEKPHSWVSIIAQLGLSLTFIYLFYTKAITADDLKKFIELITSIF